MYKRNRGLKQTVVIQMHNVDGEFCTYKEVPTNTEACIPEQEISRVK